MFNISLKEVKVEGIDNLEYTFAEKYYVKIEYVNYLKTMFAENNLQEAYIFSKGFHIGVGRSTSSEIQKLKTGTFNYRSEILTEDVAIRVDDVLVKIDTLIENTHLFLEENNKPIKHETIIAITSSLEELFLLLYPCCMNVTNADLAFYNLLAYPNQTVEKNGLDATLKLLEDIGKKIEEIESYYELN